MAQRILFLVFLTVGIQNLYGEELPYSAQDLVDNCQKAEFVDGKVRATTVDVGLCLGFLDGVMQVVELSERVVPLDICVPKPFRVEQMVRVFLKYMDNHPEDLHRSAAFQVIKAFSSAFPCAK